MTKELFLKQYSSKAFFQHDTLNKKLNRITFVYAVSQGVQDVKKLLYSFLQAICGGFLFFGLFLKGFTNDAVVLRLYESLGRFWKRKSPLIKRLKGLNHFKCFWL